eukprot:COSAG05_NODE_9408_length_626_cov_0.958254_1_plen_25_part_10
MQELEQEARAAAAWPPAGRPPAAAR